MKRRFLKIGSLALVAFGILLGLYSFNRDDKNFAIAKNLDIYYSLFRELNLFYVDDINPEKLVKTSVDKMLETLDPYTTYISESDMEDFKFMTTGEYAGIGALISKHDDKVIIAEPYEGLPAQKFGLKAGDEFVTIDGKEIVNIPLEDVTKMLKGPSSKPVKLEMKRPGHKKAFKVDVVRENIHIDPIPYYGLIEDKVGYIRLTSFTMNCSDNLKKALLDLKDQGAEKLVLDLRSNPGGLLGDAVKIVNLFVNKGQEIVNTKGKVSQWDQTYVATEMPVDTIMPMTVLVNSRSASASEIVSGSLQDLDRAVIIGTRTFGKGLVQTTRDLSYNTKLKVTTAKYYIPSGRCIQALDYSHRNKDGSVGTVPDSLISEFSTKNGRIVKDGGGIMPDITLEQDSLSTILFHLYLADHIIFDFATQYEQENKEIASAENFEITDDIYNQFKEYVHKQNFSYESISEREIEDLEKVAKNEKYFKKAEAEFKALKAKLTPNVNEDLDQFKDGICEYLRSEIVTRYYYQKGAVKSAIKHDKEVKKAIEVLNSPSEYNKLLSPSSKDTSKSKKKENK